MIEGQQSIIYSQRSFGYNEKSSINDKTSTLDQQLNTLINLTWNNLNVFMPPQKFFFKNSKKEDLVIKRIIHNGT